MDFCWHHYESLFAEKNVLNNIIIGSAWYASEFIPTAKYKPYLRPEWTPQVKSRHYTERRLRKLWISEGRLRGMEHETYKNYKRAKRNFRNELNIEHDRYMSDVFKDIDEASECDIRLFWKLIRQQKPRTSRIYPAIEHKGKLFEDPPGVSNAFAKYFWDIYNPGEDTSYDSDFFATVESTYSDLKHAHSLSTDFPVGHVSVDEIQTIIRGLKRRKAPGLDRVQNEHYIYGGIHLAKCITHLFNAILTVGCIPSCWKKDLIVPIYKGNNKPRKTPDSYRPIALLPCALKIFEKLLLTRIQTNILPSIKFPSSQQQGFQPKLGCLTASFNLQETVFHNIEQNSSVLVAFLDTQKAFDTVWRHGLMCKLHNLGISGALWSLINDCHSNTRFSVVANQTSSEWFPVSQGVRQGGVLSTFLYLVYINDLILKIQELSPNIGVFNIPSSNPTLADDICIIALTPQGLQNVLDSVFEYSQRWRFTFNAAKCNVLYFHQKGPNYADNLSWNLGEGCIKISKSYNHLGIHLNSKFDPGERTSNACRKGRQAYFALKTSEHLNPITVSKLYKRVVLPSVLYGCELWCDLRAKDIGTLNKFQHFIAKHTMGLPCHTRSDMCESRLCELDTTHLKKRIFITRLFSYLLKNDIKHYGFVQDIIPILMKYNLYPALTEYLKSGFSPQKHNGNGLYDPPYSHSTLTPSIAA